MTTPDSLIPLTSSLSSGVILSVKVWIPEDKMTEFFELFEPAYRAVVAEPECRFFVVSRHPQDPTCLSWVEGWSKDVQWLQEVQLNKPYYQPYLSTTEPWFLRDRVVELTVVKDGLAHFKTPAVS
ncbi:hypothetical protein LTR84_004907 [Exophiala bonariae]|uniref:ABM domain-containing protein n=1 Tax=Exophiala bonariae TaxID=1690606 RepID=A0AAV9NS51_9EURO|nr:hypothetical protein LTR84_004907 [Exophiala bonariae]